MPEMNKIRISHTETHKLLMPLKKYCLTSPDINGILFVVVVLRKLAMPVAGGVPCVDSIFLLYIIKANLSQYFSNQTKILLL